MVRGVYVRADGDELRLFHETHHRRKRDFSAIHHARLGVDRGRALVERARNDHSSSDDIPLPNWNDALFYGEIGDKGLARKCDRVVQWNHLRGADAGVAKKPPGPPSARGFDGERDHSDRPCSPIHDIRFPSVVNTFLGAGFREFYLAGRLSDWNRLSLLCDRVAIPSGV